MSARRGVSLLEVGLALGLVGLVSVGVVQVTGDQAGAQRAASAATMLTAVQAASQDYLRANYQALLAAVPPGGTPLVVRVGRASAAEAVPGGPTPTLPSLQGGGFLPSSYIDRNAYRHHHVLLLRQPVAGTLEGLVVQSDDAALGLGADGGAPVRDVDLGRIVARAGAVGGARFATNVNPAAAGTVQGNGGSWSSDAALWSGSGLGPQVGRAAATVSFGNASMLSDYLNRYDIGIPEANTMRAAVNMGGNDINAARTVNANQAMLQNGGNACAGNATGCRFWISDDGGFADYNDGWIRYQGAYAGAGLSIEGPGNNLYVGGGANVGQDLGVSRNVYVGMDLGAARDIYAGRNVVAAEDLGVARNAYVGVDLGVGRDAYVVQDIGVGRDAYVGRDGTVVGRLGVGGDAVVGGGATIYGGASVGLDLGAGRDLIVTRNSYTGGDVAVNGSAWLGAYLSVGLDAAVGRDVRVGSRIGTNGYDPNDLPSGWAGGVRTFDVLASGGLYVGDSAYQGVRVTSNDMRVAADGGLTTGLNVAVGSGCAAEGTLARNLSDGGMLWCQGGAWRSPSAPFQTLIYSTSNAGGTWTNTSSSTDLVLIQAYATGKSVLIVQDDLGNVIANDYELGSGGSFGSTVTVPVPPGRTIIASGAAQTYRLDWFVYR